MSFTQILKIEQKNEKTFIIFICIQCYLQKIISVLIKFVFSSPRHYAYIHISISYKDFIFILRSKKHEKNNLPNESLTMERNRPTAADSCNLYSTSIQT